jgi:clan AA aspartic protease
VIMGTVTNRRAYVTLTIRTPDGQEHQIEAVLDTGFTGVLTMPPAAVAALGLPYIGPQPATLADGSPIMLALYELTLLWDGEERLVEVLAMEGAALIGMTLLDGSDVHLQVTDGGVVRIEPL